MLSRYLWPAVHVDERVTLLPETFPEIDGTVLVTPTIPTAPDTWTASLKYMTTLPPVMVGTCKYSSFGRTASSSATVNAYVLGHEEAGYTGFFDGLVSTTTP